MLKTCTHACMHTLGELVHCGVMTTQEKPAGMPWSEFWQTDQGRQVIKSNAVDTRVPTPEPGPCTHTDNRAIYTRTRTGAKHARLVRVGVMCSVCSHVVID